MATSSSLATFIHPVLNGNVWSLAGKLAHIWTFLANTSVCGWHALVLCWISNAFLAWSANWWLWLDNIVTLIIKRDALFMDATTQVNCHLLVSLLIAVDKPVSA